MEADHVTFRILRFKAGLFDPARYQDFDVRRESGMSVLDGLEQIRLHLDPGLMYRRCCHHASCGTCACTINGTPALACVTRLDDLDGDVIILEPLAHHPCLGDLAVDMRPFFKEMDARWSNTRACDTDRAQRTPEGIDGLRRLEDCIECGCCVAGCPVMDSNPDFLGPAVLAAVNNEMGKRPADSENLLKMVSQPGGAHMCRRHLVCSRVCPSGVYPARHIADLLRQIPKSAPDDQ